MDMIVRRFNLGNPAQYVETPHQFHEMEDLLGDSKRFCKDIKEIVFLTGNQNKLRELGSSLSLNNITLSCPAVSFDLAEIQDSNILNIVQDKCLHAYDKIIKDSSGVSGHHAERKETAVLVEDTCLNFKALGGMPGPYVKWFLEAIGPEGLFKMLAGFTNKQAEAICIYALMSQPEEDGGAAILFFRGVARGHIVEPRQANPGSGWGWDPIFEEDESRLTFAEMGQEMKSRVSHRAHALTILRKFLEFRLSNLGHCPTDN